MMNKDQQMKIEQRLSVLNNNLAEISLRAETLHKKLEMRCRSRQEPTQTDRLYSRLATIQHILVEQFPQYILELEGSLVIPGLAGGGETGPGGVQFPNFDGGGTLRADPHTRSYHF
jgi:hypothetical protein